jgi:transketolase
MKSVEELESVARRLRMRVLDACMKAKGGHLGGSFSVMDILVALYLDHKRPGDKVIFSKGHACLALYAILAETGVISWPDFDEYGLNGALLGGHPKHNIPGVEICTGSLGHGLSIAAGMAYANRDIRVFCVLGDGEMNEGSVWEALMWAAQHRLKNLTAIIDANGYESLDCTNNIMRIEPLVERLQDFDWSTMEINGHASHELYYALSKSAIYSPHAIVARTIKGKGVSFMENTTKWHYRCPTAEEYEAAKKELT